LYFAVVFNVRSTLLLSVFLVGAAGGCRTKDPAIGAPFFDDFQRPELGAAWNATGPQYRLVDGKLVVSNGHNHPAWLKQRLPRDATIDLDIMSKSPAGDLKVEIYGDGESFDREGRAYTATGYVLIFGGWHNSLSVICRIEEHDQGRKTQRTDVRVQPGKTYHWTITRRGGTIDWKIDGQPFLAWTDPEPLAGAGHEYFALNDWETEVTMDNLRITPAP
jgi:hypothetical protein